MQINLQYHFILKETFLQNAMQRKEIIGENQNFW